MSFELWFLLRGKVWLLGYMYFRNNDDMVLKERHTGSDSIKSG